MIVLVRKAFKIRIIPDVWSHKPSINCFQSYSGRLVLTREEEKLDNCSKSSVSLISKIFYCVQPNRVSTWLLHFSAPVVHSLQCPLISVTNLRGPWLQFFGGEGGGGSKRKTRQCHIGAAVCLSLTRWIWVLSNWVRSSKLFIQLKWHTCFVPNSPGFKSQQSWNFFSG